MTKDSTAIVPITQRFAALSSPAGISQALAANFSGPNERLSLLDLERIKIPAGGGPAFTIVSPGGETDAVKEITGIIVAWTSQRLWWAGSMEDGGGKQPPSCVSTDLVIGIGDNGTGAIGRHDCATCPRSQWGSSRKGGKGQDCKQVAIIAMLRQGREKSVFPSVLIAPPTSLQGWRKYRVGLTTRSLPFFGLETQIAIETAKNDGGTSYSRAIFRPGRALDEKEVEAVAAYTKQVQMMMGSLAAHEAAADDSAESSESN